VTTFPLEEYAPIIGPHNLEELKLLARKVEGRRVHHINSTAVGGGVAEILHRLIPLFNELGILARWDVIKGGSEFFEVTKAFHNALHGRSAEFEPRMFKVFYEYTRKNAKELDLSDDVVVIHDP
jgi:trehalose synthase